MAAHRFAVTAAVSALLLLGWRATVRAQEPSAPTPGAQTQSTDAWPRTFEAEGYRFTVYQPQVEKWDGTRLLARSAVAVESAASPQPSFGVIWIAARTAVDREERSVALDRFEIPRASFPTGDGKSDAWLALLRSHVPSEVQRIDLDRLESSLAVTRAEEKTESAPLRNDAPRIFFATRPALLVLVDGAPVERRAGGTELLRVINTRSLLLHDDKGGRWYLAVGPGWLEAARLEGPWSVAAVIPKGADDLKAEAQKAGHVTVFESDPEMTTELVAGRAPAVFTSTTAAELVETHGDPELVPIDGTKLLWVRNTEAELFVDTATSLHYALLSGRWFKAASREGPWTFVRSAELPADFARIPPTHPAGEVLASIAGTSQAQEARIANEIPQTATVRRSDARLEVKYDGAPQLAAIDGTKLQYALNSRTPVIRFEDRFYACEDGIWFTGPTTSGPWTVADAVPAEVYAIPPSCPVHYVTYVRVYDATPELVYYGYTPGYFGCCLLDGCVVWGTGYWHRPWIGGLWIGGPCTYGFSVGLRWSPGWGVSLGFGLGGRPACRPWWGPLRRPHDFWPSGGRPARVNVANVNVYRSTWNQAVVRSSSVRGGARPGGVSSERGPGVAPRSHGDLYASPEGRVFRRDASGWERHDAGAWHRSDPRVEEERTRSQHLEAEHRARESGGVRSENLQRPPPEPSRPQHHAPIPQRPRPHTHR